MLGPPPGTRVFLACGVTDMRKGFDGLAAQVQTVLAQDPCSGALFCFRGGGAPGGRQVGQARRPALRKPLLAHLPRETVVHEPVFACRCGCADPAHLT